VPGHLGVWEKISGVTYVEEIVMKVKDGKSELYVNLLLAAETKRMHSGIRLKTRSWSTKI
jgi:hypothetical protein